MKPRWQLRWWRPGGFRLPPLARLTKGQHGMGRWTEAEVQEIHRRAALDVERLRLFIEDDQP